jgi:hypothetical protein
MRGNHENGEHDPGHSEFHVKVDTSRRDELRLRDEQREPGREDDPVHLQDRVQRRPVGEEA